jgi:hypothetical protein
MFQTLRVLCVFSSAFLERLFRNFLQAMGATPSLALLRAAVGQAQAAPADKFTGVDLSAYFNTSPREFAANFYLVVR